MTPLAAPRSEVGEIEKIEAKYALVASVENAKQEIHDLSAKEIETSLAQSQCRRLRMLVAIALAMLAAAGLSAVMTCKITRPNASSVGAPRPWRLATRVLRLTPSAYTKPSNCFARCAACKTV